MWKRLQAWHIAFGVLPHTSYSQKTNSPTAQTTSQEGHCEAFGDLVADLAAAVKARDVSPNKRLLVGERSPSICSGRCHAAALDPHHAARKGRGLTYQQHCSTQDGRQGSSVFGHREVISNAPVSVRMWLECQAELAGCISTVVK